MSEDDLHFSQFLILSSGNPPQPRQGVQCRWNIGMYAAVPSSIIRPRRNISLTSEQADVVTSIASKIDLLYLEEFDPGASRLM